MARNCILRIAVFPLLFLFGALGCSSLMEAYREQTNPSSDRPIQCKFVCPAPQESEAAPGESWLDNLVVVDLRENQEVVGSMYSANGPFNLVCREEMLFERVMVEEMVSLLGRHSISVGGDRTGRPPSGVSLYVEILDIWVESRDPGWTDIQLPIEASVIFRAVLQDDKSGVVLWEAEFRGVDTKKVYYSFSRHHAASFEKAYCEAIRSFETAIGSTGFLEAIRR